MHAWYTPAGEERKSASVHVVVCGRTDGRTDGRIFVDTVNTHTHTHTHTQRERLPWSCSVSEQTFARISHQNCSILPPHHHYHRYLDMVHTTPHHTTPCCWGTTITRSVRSTQQATSRTSSTQPAGDAIHQLPTATCIHTYYILMVRHAGDWDAGGLAVVQPPSDPVQLRAGVLSLIHI